MPDIKQMSFILLVLLVSVTSLYEWAQADPVLGINMGIGNIAGFEVASLSDYLAELQLVSEGALESAIRIDLVAFLESLVSLFIVSATIFMKLIFGWAILVGAIFSAVGLEGLDIIFTGPLAIIQIFALFYFLRDLVNTVRGVGTG